MVVLVVFMFCLLKMKHKKTYHNDRLLSFWKVTLYD